MPIELMMDRIEGTTMNLGSQGSQATRGFYIHGLDESVRGDQALGVIYAKILAVGFKFGVQHPNFPTLALARIAADPVGAGQFRGQLIYETINPQFATGTAYLIEKRTTLQQYQTNFVPGTREPIRVNWSLEKALKAKDIAKDKNQNIAGWTGAEVPEDYVSMTLLRPMRTITVSQIRLGVSGEGPGTDDYVGYVNRDDWQGLPPAYWMLTDFQEKVNRNEGYFSLSATAMSKNAEDWSEAGVLQHAITGRYCPTSKEEIQKVFFQDYRFENFNNETPIKAFENTPGSKVGGKTTRPTRKIVKRSQSQIIPGNGFVRVCPYPGVSFQALFGFK